MYLASDNGTGASEQVLSALNEAMRAKPMPSYGGDELTKKLEEKFTELFEHEVEIFLLTSGTAANALALAQISPPWGAILAHEEAHIVTSECGAPEFFSGARVVGLQGSDAKVTPQALQGAIDFLRIEDPHGLQPAALSLTNLSEAGTLYRPEEIKSLSALAHQTGMKVHLDGARFANAIAALKCKPAELSWRAGVDVMSLGATKNGAIAAEAIIFFDRKLAKDFKFRRMRAGHLISKHRFIAAQFLGWLENDHWLELATHANIMAQQLAKGLAVKGISLAFPCEGNEVFAYLPHVLDASLRERGAVFYPWTSRSMSAKQPEGTVLSRFVCAFSTKQSDIDGFLQLINTARAA
jgi:threonine aldolase